MKKRRGDSVNCLYEKEIATMIFCYYAFIVRSNFV